MRKISIKYSTVLCTVSCSLKTMFIYYMGIIINDLSNYFILKFTIIY